MTISTISVGAAVTPTVVKTYVSHYASRKARRQKPTAHISYDEGLHLIRAFLKYASHNTVEDLQAFTSQWVPHPRWVRVESVTIPADHISKSADVITQQLGNRGIDRLGGSSWWQWRQKGAELKADWIEMRGDYNARKKEQKKCTRVMLYVHGGAYFFGSVDEHRYQMQRHARKLKARVLAPRYRLAPQYPFPCGLQDCLAVYLYLLTVQDPTEIILAGDSAGGGMVVTLLCILRDRGLPLPAGAILISPWCDLTHSFPSLADDSSYDYIPARGFMQKPSAGWPPPNEDEIEAIATGAISQLAGQAVARKSTHRERKDAEDEAVQGFAVYHTEANQNDQARQNPNNPAGKNEPHPRAGNRIPGSGHQLSIEIDDEMVVIKDQIQMYTTNQLISHPLVSPVLQPSLGGLPPLLIMTGGGEVLRDEQIYLAHKAAHPAKYPLGDAYRNEYDPDDAILKKYPPTPVQLQVWDDLCHVAPTLSFTRPAKFMYRSIAQFGAWALARAQKTSIEITDDDQISIISSGSESDTETDVSTTSLAKQKENESTLGKVGRAGDPLPAFHHNMIRQRVDRHGEVHPLAHEADLPALQMDKNEVGVIKPGPVRKWMEAKQQWDGKYKKIKRKLQKQRIKEMSMGGVVGFGAGESPPPSALAGRRKKDDVEMAKNKKSYGLAMWSMFGSKHDEHTIQREEEIEKDSLLTGQPAVEETMNGARPSRRTSSSKAQQQNASRSRSRRGTIMVSRVADQGQTEGRGDEPANAEGDGQEIPAITADADADTDTHHLTPIFLPKYKNLPPHLRGGPKDDSSSVRTSHTTGDIESLRNASTTAVFAAPGVLPTPNRDGKATNASSLLSAPGMTAGDDEDENAAGLRSEVASTMRPETPASTRSVERLQGDQDPEHDNDMHLRSPSNVAIVASEGVIGEVDGPQNTDRRQRADVRRDDQEH